MKNKMLPFILAIVLLAVGFWAGRTTQAPEQGSAGTIGAADRAQSEQITAYDVEIEQPELQEILQSDEFEQMVQDGVFEELFANPELADLWAHPEFTQSLSRPEVVLALANPDLTQTMAMYKESLSLMARPRISTSLGVWMTEPEVRRTLDQAIRFRDDTGDGDALTLTQALQAHPELYEVMQRPEIQAMWARPDFRVLMANEHFRNALAKPAFVEALSRPQVRTALASPRFTRTLSSPRLRVSLSYTALTTYLSEPVTRQRFIDPGNP